MALEEAQIISEAAHATESAGSLGALGINLKIFIAQLINFAVVLLVLWKFAYKPVLNMLDERSKKIEKSMKNAEEIDKRLSAVEDERTEIIQNARNEANKIVEASRQDAETRGQKLIENAKAEVGNVLQQGKNQLRAEQQAMIREAKQEMAAIAVAGAEKILRDQIDEIKSKDIAESVVNKMTSV